MNLPVLVVSIIVLLMTLQPAYEIWFRPEKYAARISARRDSAQRLFGFPLLRFPQGNVRQGRLLSLLLIIICIIGVVFSISGPIRN